MRNKQARVVGNWKLVKKIGEGGQGTVWEVRPTERKRCKPLAMKLCESADEQQLERFKREVELLKVLGGGHQNLMEVVESSMALPTPYYVMPLARGSIDDKKLVTDLFALLRYFRQACDAVAHLHSRDIPIIHRDIKPKNILITDQPSWKAVVADFGIAAEDGTQGELTATQEAVGSKWYLAPESGAAGDSVKLDVYGLGRTLECLLTGKRPECLEPRKVPREDLNLSRPASDALDKLITKATAPLARDRYASVGDLLKDLPELCIDVVTRDVVLESALALIEPELKRGQIEDANPEDFVLIKPGESLGSIDPRRDGTRIPVLWRPNVGYSFLRFEPLMPRKRMSQLETLDVVRGGMPSFSGAGGYDWSSCEHGAAYFPVGGRDDQIETSDFTLVDKEGGVVMVDGWRFSRRDESSSWILGAFPFENSMLKALSDAWRRLPQKGYETVVVTAGLVGMKNTVIGLPQSFWRRTGEMTYESHVLFRIGQRSLADSIPSLKDFFEDIWAAYGMERPARSTP